MVENAPGKKALRRRSARAAGSGGAAARAGAVAWATCSSCTRGSPARWAARGLEGLNRCAAAAWAALDSDRRAFADRCSAITRAAVESAFAEGDGTTVERSLAAALERLGARRLVIGHTQTRSLPSGASGRILTRFDDRVACVDVGLRDEDASTWAALVVDRRGGREWEAFGRKSCCGGRGRPATRHGQRQGKARVWGCG